MDKNARILIDKFNGRIDSLDGNILNNLNLFFENIEILDFHIIINKFNIKQLIRFSKYNSNNNI